MMNLVELFFIVFFAGLGSSAIFYALIITMAPLTEINNKAVEAFVAVYYVLSGVICTGAFFYMVIRFVTS
ncbi:hypothetical protein [Thalassobacillus devorans]|uniref:hypothetical protein n=1 Tax=Thalassobacillus devorans TaxID=279813 RepID=UPI000A1CA4A4|nr:hypothetical protein [Thalassobacillus devorans]